MLVTSRQVGDEVTVLLHLNEIVRIKIMNLKKGRVILGLDVRDDLHIEQVTVDDISNPTTKRTKDVTKELHDGCK